MKKINNKIKKFIHFHTPHKITLPVLMITKSSLHRGLSDYVNNLTQTTEYHTAVISLVIVLSARRNVGHAFNNYLFVMLYL